MRKKAIIGAGGFGREVKYMLLDNNPTEIIDFFVEDEYAFNTIKPLSSLNFEEYEVVVAIADPNIRKRIVNTLPSNTKYYTVIHKSVQLLDPEIKIGEGCIICSNSVLTTNIVLGNHCHVNLHTTIGHDVKIGDFFTSAPGVKISGNCVVGNRVYMGTNSSIREGLTLCHDVVIGMNAAVIKSINNPGIYAGVPAKEIIKNKTT